MYTHTNVCVYTYIHTQSLCMCIHMYDDDGDDAAAAADDDDDDDDLSPFMVARPLNQKNKLPSMFCITSSVLYASAILPIQHVASSMLIGGSSMHSRFRTFQNMPNSKPD